MHHAFVLLDQAIELGRRELAHLAAGEVDKAEKLAFGRDGIVTEALAERSLSGPAADSLDALLERLEVLKNLQAEIIREASRLKDDIGGRIRMASQEHKRHAGYGQSTRPVPRIRSRYISRQG